MDTDIEKTLVAEVSKLVEDAVPKVEELTDNVLDEAQVAVEDATKAALDAITEAIDSNPVVEKIEAVIDSNPQLKDAVDKLESKIVEAVDGRLFSCWCFGWWFSLKITRQDPRKTLSTQPQSTVTAEPVPSVEVKEWSPPKVAVETS
jgi:hypothetical protein